MARTASILALLAVLALAGAGPSVAAPPWEAPRQAALGCDCTLQDLEFGGSGRALALAEAESPDHPWLAARDPAGSWTARQGPRVGRATLGVHGDRALLLGVVGDQTRISRVALASGTTDGHFASARNLGHGTRPALAVDPSGAALAAWVRLDGEIVAMQRRPGGHFGAPVRVGVTRLLSYPIAVAVNSGGEGVVMWRAPNRRATVRGLDRRGRRLAPIELGRTGGTDTYALALAGDGRFTAAWSTQFIYARGATSPPWISAFTGSIRGRRATGRELDRFSEAAQASRRLRVELDSADRPIVAWASNQPEPGTPGGDRRVIRHVTGDGRGALGPVATTELPDRHALLADLETGPGGSAVLLFTSSGGPLAGGPQEPPRIYARHRAAANDQFGSNELIDDLAGAPVVAFDPLSGRPLAAWGSVRTAFRN